PRLGGVAAAPVMKIDFPFRGYEGIAPVEIPDGNLMGVYAPAVDPAPVDEDAVMARGIAAPVGAPRLRELLSRETRVLILVDDGTRGTPIARLLPLVAGELEAAGVADSRVAVLTAQGTHRRMSEEELRHKLGGCRDRFAVHQHDWLDEANLREYGRT